MKHLSLERREHRRLEEAFREWLELTGYAKSTTYYMPFHVREFLHYLEGEGKELEVLTPGEVHGYFSHLRRRKKRRRPGVLSTNHLHKHLQALRRFAHYLRATGQGGLEVDITLPGQERKVKEVLTKEEIGALYEVCDTTPLGLRDRAMLAVCYGCGLRRSEAQKLDTTDLLKEKGLLYVRGGKAGVERYVPLTEGVMEDLEEYLWYGRPVLVRDPGGTAFFLSKYGRRPDGQSLMSRLKRLTEKAGIDKDAGLHTLRHSIATHLLESGMSLDHIGRFLGHRSLESTQIYTHIMNDE